MEQHRMAGKLQKSGQTSKRLKIQQILALIVIILSFFAIALDLGLNENNPNMAIKMLGTLFLIFGIFWFGIVSVQIWWHRG